jgi:hypothetical protein
MIRVFGVLVVLIAIVAGVGFYRGWFRAESGVGNGQDAVTVTVDKDKINQDKVGAEQQVQDLRHK